ncbi:MAG TPA: hypothetical protein VM821_06050 [Abditibacteriaceae bacterium]|nr:hypothetical protein [Abditibacteriaceae bacterium]
MAHDALSSSIDYTFLRTRSAGRTSSFIAAIEYSIVLITKPRNQWARF